ncbi:Zinc finger and BTB domain-containing protein 14 [Porphyridium purpureum]|uniref:Zinc finger and BTB domain-containing protein 14 n=1 Tax=Porphyridium purpureum TaxID=35688 RepID=A0A5J4YXZ5_PORPP|nr:Zinc finger and BTB domain-containing protein 14 [Porphyridium purpureum]|eukprot:POR7742..scf209_3
MAAAADFPHAAVSLFLDFEDDQRVWAGLLALFEVASVRQWLLSQDNVGTAMQLGEESMSMVEAFQRLDRNQYTGYASLTPVRACGWFYAAITQTLNGTLIPSEYTGLPPSPRDTAAVSTGGMAFGSSKQKCSVCFFASAQMLVTVNVQVLQDGRLRIQCGATEPGAFIGLHEFVAVVGTSFYQFRAFMGWRNPELSQLCSRGGFHVQQPSWAAVRDLFSAVQMRDDVEYMMSSVIVDPHGRVLAEERFPFRITYTFPGSGDRSMHEGPRAYSQSFPKCQPEWMAAELPRKLSLDRLQRYQQYQQQQQQQYPFYPHRPYATAHVYGVNAGPPAEYGTALSPNQGRSPGSDSADQGSGGAAVEGGNFTRSQSQRPALPPIELGVDYVVRSDLAPEDTKTMMCLRCSLAFRQISHLKEHINAIHRGLRPHVCEICKQTFTRAGNLKQHERQVHSDERPYACDQCGKSFKLPARLKTHVREVHGVLTSSPAEAKQDNSSASTSQDSS